MGYRVGIDIGGTTVKGALIENGEKILYKEFIKTPFRITFKDMEKEIGRLIDVLLKKGKIERRSVEYIGIGIPGTVESRKKIVKYACNLGWENEKLSSFLEKEYEAPVFIENDVNIAAIGEYVYSGLKEKETMVLIALGTGVGAGIILDGRLYRGFNFSAGEVGHMIIKKGGRECNCKNRGCFERYASGTGIVETAFEKMNRNKGSKLREYLKEKGELTAEAVFEIASKKDKAALETIEEFVEDLSVGVANIINILQPEVLVVGGGVSNSGEVFIERLKEKVKEKDYAKNCEKRCEIKISKLKSDAGVFGAANLEKFL